MRIAHYYPKVITSENFQTLFCSHTGYEFTEQCDKDTDIIYAASISVLEKAIEAKKKYKKPLVCWVWDIPLNWREWVEYDPIGFQLNQFRDELNNKNIELLKQCDLVISASKYTQNVLKSVGIESKQIYFYIDTNSLDSVPEQVKEDQVIQISRYFFNKRFELSVLATRDLPYKMVCVGFGKDYCKARLIGLPNDNVEYYVDLPKEDVVRHLKRSKILVSPSVFEGWGMSPIEALYCKIPVVLNDLQVFHEVYGDKVIYHKTDDIDDMAEKIKYVMDNESIQKEIVDKCKTTIMQFTPKKFANRFKKVIREI